jgi:hypothetical protein
MRRLRITRGDRRKEICDELNEEEQPQGKALRWALMRWRELAFWLGVIIALYILGYAVPIH